MRRLVNKKVAVLTILAGFALVGLVYAAWTTNGTGNAYSKAGTAQTLSTVEVSASTSATLYPGVSGDVLVKIDNPNPGLAKGESAGHGAGERKADEHAAGPRRAVRLQRGNRLAFDVHPHARMTRPRERRARHPRLRQCERAAARANANCLRHVTSQCYADQSL